LDRRRQEIVALGGTIPAARCERVVDLAMNFVSRSCGQFVLGLGRSGLAAAPRYA